MYVVTCNFQGLAYLSWLLVRTVQENSTLSLAWLRQCSAACCSTCAVLVAVNLQAMFVLLLVQEIGSVAYLVDRLPATISSAKDLFLALFFLALLLL